jgi:hypothetical protein
MLLETVITVALFYLCFSLCCYFLCFLDQVEKEGGQCSSLSTNQSYLPFVLDDPQVSI